MNDDKLFDADRLRELFIKNAGYFIACFVALSYIATSLITISETGKSFVKIFGDGVQAFLAGVLITRGLSLQGITRGMNEQVVKDAIKRHSDQVLEVESYVDDLDDWCDIKTAQALRRERTKVLASCSMRYADWFDEDGIAKPYVVEDVKGRLTKSERKRRKARLACYKKAASLKITPLSASVLTGGKSKLDDPYNFGADPGDFERNNTRRDIASKIFIGIAFGYYAVDMLSGISVADTIFKVFQVCLFLGGGLVQLLRSYMYMIDGFCKRLDSITGKLKEFEATKKKKEVKEDGG